MKLKHFINELQRRNVIKAAISYVVFSWVLIQAASIVYPSFGWGQKAISNTLIVLIIAFPVWIVFAYIFEWTPSGFKKTNEVAAETSISKRTGKKLNGVIIAGLSLAVLLLVSDRIFNFTGAMETEATTNDKSIAVLAFADMSPEKDQEYFSDGISEEILNLLAKVPDLKVISRTSSFSFKGKEVTTAEIGKILHVDHLLEGSIRKSGNTFRITAQLINVADGAHIWSETYDREMSDIFKIQDEIAGKVTQQLKVTLLGELASKPLDPEAYSLYLQAKRLARQRNVEANKNAEILIRQAIAIDSSYAPAWDLLSEIIYSHIYRYPNLSMTQENFNMGMDAAKRAIALDPDYALGYAGLASFERANWDFTAANSNMYKALSLAPEDADVIGQAAINAIDLGKLEEAVQLQVKVVALDPLNYNRQFNLGLSYWLLKDYSNAEKHLQTFLLHYPNAEAVHSAMALVYLGQSNTENALVAIEREPAPFWKLYRQCMVVYAVRDKQEADTLLKKFIENWSEVAWPNIASVYAFRGEKEKAFKWLDLAYEQRDVSILEILNYSEMENLWGDPRWNAFINKLGLPEDHGFHRD
ncbi:hypothetical protein ACS386_00500 [Flavobacteriaceae bacterium LMO-SS05]